MCVFVGTGLCVQAMDTASVCLVSMELGQESFDPYRCDKNIILGVNLSKYDMAWLTAHSAPNTLHFPFSTVSSRSSVAEVMMMGSP